MMLEGRLRYICSWWRSRSEFIFAPDRQHVSIGDNSQKSAWSLLASVLIFLIVFNSTTAAVSPGIHNTQSCPSTCNCLEDKMTCNGVIPDYTPETVRSLVLAEVDSREFYATRFCYVSWKNITDINIKDVRFSGKSFNLSGMVFDCLVNIISFKFSSQFLAHFTIDTFFGLKNVRVFDLSDCPLTDWQDLYETLSVRTNMPKITQLLLSNSGVHSYLYINQAFVNVLSYRPLACIDLSFTRFIMDFSEPGMLCKTLKSFKYASSDHTGSKTFKHSRICDSLRTIDESNDNYYKRRFHNFACINRLLMFAFPSPFFWNTRVIRSSGSITSSEKFLVSNCTIVLWIESQLLELYFSHNYLPDLDARLYNTRLEILSLSHCQIESINSDAFRYLGSLHTLDLSNNCLFKMEGRNNSLSVLFKHNNNLKVIYLSGNKLTHLPSETFISNVNLRELNLPVNSLKQITFNISQLLNLTVLDLRNNSIRSLNEPSRIHLDSLYNKQRIRYKTSHNRSVLQVFLEGNPFSCDCTSKEFLQWFVTSPLFFATRQNHYCKLDGRDIQMTEAAIDAAKNDCSRAKRRKLIELLSSTLLSTCFVVCIITTIILYKRRIKKLKERRFQGGIQRLAENRSRFPVFLSYSSDDSDFVKLHLLPQFQYHLRLLTGLDRELVCNADEHFRPARTIMSEIFRCLKESEVFIAVVSENYCTSRFCRYEIEHTHLLKTPIILIFKEHVEEDNMNLVTREVFETFTRVQFVVEDGQYRIQPDWPQLCESIIQLIN